MIVLSIVAILIAFGFIALNIGLVFAINAAASKEDNPGPLALCILAMFIELIAFGFYLKLLIAGVKLLT